MPNHYLNFDDINANECETLLRAAANIKSVTASATASDAAMRYRAARGLANRLLVMVFEKSSTRTRVSFAGAMTQAGGAFAEIATDKIHFSRGETVADTARALSSYADALMLRVVSHRTLEDFAEYAFCPVINGLSDLSHPCQTLADVLTFRELRGDLRGRRVAWLGDCNNVLYSWAQAAAMFGCELAVACPPAYRRELPAAVFYDDIDAAVDGADLVMTDAWVSMGDTDVEARRAAFAPYTVTAQRMALAAPEALFMHCLPAYRGQEVSAEVIDGAQSVVWQQAQNRLHAQKALILFLLGALPADDAAHGDALPAAGSSAAAAATD